MLSAGAENGERREDDHGAEDDAEGVLGEDAAVLGAGSVVADFEGLHEVIQPGARNQREDGGDVEHRRGDAQQAGADLGIERDRGGADEHADDPARLQFGRGEVRGPRESSADDDIRNVTRTDAVHQRETAA